MYSRKFGLRLRGKCRGLANHGITRHGGQAPDVTDESLNKRKGSEDAPGSAQIGTLFRSWSLARKRNPIHCAAIDFAQDKLRSRSRIRAIRAIRGYAKFTAAFPRRVFGKPDRYVKDPRWDRA
jgi:hypothetical protein